MAALSPIVVALGGGKGGVGKSLVAANLSVALARHDARVVLVDADLGAANIHTIFGIDRPGQTIQAFIDRKVKSLAELTTATSIPRVFIVPGSGAVPGAANIAHAQKQKLIRHIRQIDADVVVIDVGAGVSLNVIDFFDTADLRLCVVTPQLTSLQNAYSFLKGAVYRALRETAQNPAEVALLKSATSNKETERISHVLEKIGREDPSLVTALRNTIHTFGARIIGNQIEKRDQVNILHALSRMLIEFLNLEAPVIGAIGANSALHHSVSKRKLFLEDHADSVEAQTFMNIASLILTTDIHALRAERKRLDVEDTDAATASGASAASGEDQDSTLPLPATLDDYLRRYERHHVELPASLRTETNQYGVLISDISVGGALLTTEAKLTLGSRVALALSNGASIDIQATVRRVDESQRRAGIEFENILEEEHLRKLLQKPATEKASTPHH